MYGEEKNENEDSYAFIYNALLTFTHFRYRFFLILFVKLLIKEIEIKIEIYDLLKRYNKKGVMVEIWTKLTITGTSISVPFMQKLLLIDTYISYNIILTMCKQFEFIICNACT